MSPVDTVSVNNHMTYKGIAMEKNPIIRLLTSSAVKIIAMAIMLVVSNYYLLKNYIIKPNTDILLYYFVKPNRMLVRKYLLFKDSS